MSGKKKLISRATADGRKHSKMLWRLGHERIWVSKRIHNTWKLFKSYGIFTSDTDFAAHLLALELQRQRRIIKKGSQVVRVTKMTPKCFRTKRKNVPLLTSTPHSKSSLFKGSAACELTPVEEIDNSLIDVTGSWLDESVTSILDGSVITIPDESFQSDNSDDLFSESFESSDSNDEECQHTVLQQEPKLYEKSELQLQNIISVLDNESDSGSTTSSDSLDSLSSTNEDQEEMEQTVEKEVPQTEDAPPVSEKEEELTFMSGPGRRFSRYEESSKYQEELLLVKAPKVVTTVSRVVELFKGRCQEPGCTNKTEVKSRTVGATLEIWWSCSGGHRGKWTSSEEYEGMYANNLQFSAATLLSGNNFRKVQLFSEFLSLRCPSEASFYRAQKFYCVPAIAEWWEWMRGDIISLIGDLEVIASGDGQSDSPGHSAKYLTYYMMITNQLEEYIMHIEVIDKREVGGKSPNMEREALNRAINSLKNIIKMKEVVTDASSSIIKMLADEFREIVHSLDIWHKAKNIRKCLLKVAKLKGNEKIAEWIDHIINHFWYSCANCEGSEEKLKTIWISLLYHVTNLHEWVDGQCGHDDLPEEHNLPWFDRRDKDYQALQEVVLSNRLLATLKYYVNFRHTGRLETANSHSLMYAPKRCAFSFQGFKARKTLAAIDHNYHLYRQPIIDEDGKPRVSRKYIPRTKHWDSVVIKEDKDYAYIPQLMAKVFEMRKVDSGNMQDYVEMAVNDPRRIAQTIAAVQPLPSQELYALHKSRYEMGK